MNSNVIRTFGIIMLVLLVLGTVIALLFYWNSFILRGLVSDFKSELRAAEGIEIVETVSDYGKLNGNGNGINYFGAVLVKVEGPDVLDTLVSLNKDFDVMDYYKSWYTPENMTTIVVGDFNHKKILDMILNEFKFNLAS